MPLRSAQLNCISLSITPKEYRVYFAYGKQQIALCCSKRLEDFFNRRHISLENDHIVDRLFGVLYCPLGGNQYDLDDTLARVFNTASFGDFTAVNTLSASMKPLSACLTDANISSLVARSSTALYRAVNLTRSVEGCKMLARSSLAPIGVNVSFNSPNKLSLDFAFCRFWISSRETIVAKSIVMDPWDGSKRIRRECAVKDRWSSTSTYLRT